MVEARVTVARLRADVLPRVTVVLRFGARLVMDAFFTPARRALRDETRALFTGARYAGTEKAASEPATSCAIFDTYPRVSPKGGTPRWRRTLPGPAL